MDSMLKAAMDAVERQDYEQAVRLLRPLAESGNAMAQNNIGTLYQLGLGVQRDLQEAVKWLKLAVDQGDGSAAHNLGTIYLTGFPEMPIDQNESKKWYRKARELGFEVADQSWYE
jgi:uncharacterized protein